MVSPHDPITVYCSPHVFIHRERADAVNELDSWFKQHRATPTTVRGFLDDFFGDDPVSCGTTETVAHPVLSLVSTLEADEDLQRQQ